MLQSMKSKRTYCADYCMSRTYAMQISDAFGSHFRVWPLWLWHSGRINVRRSVTGELSLSYARPAANG